MIGVSFIVPIYNVEQYLDKCINSLLNQTYQSFEIILIDDGSPDRCGEICDSYAQKDNRIRVLHKSNEGLSAARNNGIEMAKGEWVCFIDSDDYLEDTHIESLLKNTSSKCYDIIIGNYTLHDQTINKAYHPKSDIAYGEYNRSAILDFILKDLILSGSCMSVWRNLYKLELIRNNNLLFVSERLVYAEDYIFNIEAYSLAHHIKAIEAHGYNHILQKKSLSQSYRRGFYQMALRRYNEGLNRLHRYHGNKYDTYCNKISIISSSLYKESLCEYSIGVNNIKQIIKSNFAQSVFKEHNRIYNKYTILYYLAKYNLPVSVVLIAKLFSLMERPYRYFNYLRSIR